MHWRFWWRVTVLRKWLMSLQGLSPTVTAAKCLSSELALFFTCHVGRVLLLCPHFASQSMQTIWCYTRKFVCFFL